MASTVRPRMADRGCRVPLGLRGSGIWANSSNRLSGAGMRQSSLSGDLPHLLKAPLPAKIKLRTALAPKAPPGTLLLSPAARLGTVPPPGETESGSAGTQPD